jgi:hypothetical protein
MRTSIDIPDSLFERLKACSLERNTTLRALVISAVEKEVAGTSEPVLLRDAAVGDPADGIVSHEELERQMADDREPDFQP